MCNTICDSPYFHAYVDYIEASRDDVTLDEIRSAMLGQLVSLAGAPNEAELHGVEPDEPMMIIDVELAPEAPGRAGWQTAVLLTVAPARMPLAPEQVERRPEAMKEAIDVHFLRRAVGS